MAVGNLATSISRGQRGTKRMCVDCEIAFYDLTKSPIICPACGGVHTPVVREVIELRRPSSPSSAWRSRSPVRNSVVPAAEAPEGAVDGDEADEVVADDLEEADVSGAAVDDDTVLEQEADDADASALIEIDDDEPKDQ
jgi:uncharacterized protein (TIGR02300 family)